MDIWTIVLLGISLLIMIAGLVGIIVPVIPSTPLIWGGAFLYAIFTEFEEITWKILIVFAFLTVFTLVADFIANMYGAKKFGASTWGVIGSTVGMIVGAITTGIIGLVLGAFLGAIISELILGKHYKDAFNAGVGSFLGFLGGSLIKLIIGFVMIGYFIWAIL